MLDALRGRVMQGRFVAREYVWISVDPLSTVLYPVAIVAVMTVLGEIALSFGWLRGWYSSAYVMGCALVANRVCLRAGIVCAGLSAITHSYVFVHPRWAFEVPPPEQAIAYFTMFVVAYAVGRREAVRRPPTDDPIVPGATMPFTAESRHDDTRRFWVVESSGDWSEDTQVGSEYGRIYLECARRSHRAPLLGWVVADMIRGGRYTGVEAGFLSVVGRAAADASRAALAPRQQDDANDC